MRSLTTLCLFLFFHATHADAAETKPMNIVVLFADDWRHDTLSLRMKKTREGIAGIGDSILLNAIKST